MRAAELQAGDREIGEGLTEKELLGLGQEVGIPEAYLKQALLEEQTRATVAPETGVMAWLAGPRRVSVSRTIAGAAARIEAQLDRWMTESELLTVKRRFPQRTSWEPRQGAFASIKRSLGFGGRAYLLARAREIAGGVTAVDNARTHVQLTADLGNTFSDRLSTSAGLVGTGAAGTVVAVVLGVAAPVAAIPVAIGAAIGAGVVRGRHKEVEKVQVALEQVLDRLERGDAGGGDPAGGPGALFRIAEEIRKTLGP